MNSNQKNSLIILTLGTALLYFLFEVEGQSLKKFSSVANRLHNPAEAKVTETGRWRPFRETATTKDTSDQKALTKLLSLSYFQGYHPTPPKSNVTLYKPQLAFNGYNLFSSGHSPEAFLMDMKGNVLHKWRYEVDRIWSEEPQSQYGTYWQRVHVFENGDLLALFATVGLIKLDKNSNLLWAYGVNGHHDFALDDQGNIYILTFESSEFHGHKVFDNVILVLTKDREMKKKISILNLFKKLPNQTFIKQILEIAKREEETFTLDYFENLKGDILHVNTLEVFDGTLVHKSPLFKKGNALICVRNLGVVAIIDLEEEKFVWLSGPKMWHKGLHGATILKSGHLLIFDNYHTATQSRVVEFDPLTEKVIWDHTGIPSDELFSSTWGANQRLPNGNTLITESDNGRAFEVTPNGKTVWEYFNPYRAGENNELIATLFIMTRLDSSFPLGWLRD